ISTPPFHPLVKFTTPNPSPCCQGHILPNEMTCSPVIMWDANERQDSFFMLPTSITVLDLSAYVGLLAVGAFTLNMLLGLLMAFRYSPHRSWPHRRFNYFRLHNWMGYVALGVSILHPAILLRSKNPRFRILDLAYPVHSPSQPLDNTIGAIAIYLLAFVAVTSYIRIRLGRHLWKAFPSPFISPPPLFSGTAYSPILP